ncbi:MAG: hypothetical protein Q9167_003167 [Letrouitia subvulpina]
MEILESNEMWTVDNDSEPFFAHTRVILRQGAQYYYAKSSHRYRNISDIDPLALEAVPIPDSHRRPAFPPTGLTRAPEPLPQDCYIKSPSLIQYEEGEGSTFIGSIMLHEAKMCELLRESPHPNIAKFLGCLVEGDRMTGLCFVRYGETLSDMVTKGRPFDKNACLADIRMGIEHLHGLGIIHCDINPTNIFSDGDNFVLGDFDSCTLQGNELGLKGGTPDWTDETFDVARPENDWLGFTKIEAFLFPDKATESTCVETHELDP